MEPRYQLDHAAWLWHPDLAAEENGLVLFRLEFVSAAPETVQLQLSADLCYAFALNGELLARGPDTGGVDHWSFSTYEIRLSAGKHCFEALVWWARPPVAPTGRATWRGGFACAGLQADAERFTTGSAPWKVASLDGVTWGSGIQGFYHVIGGAAMIDLDAFDPARAVWCQPAVVRAPVTLNACGIIAPGWQLHPSSLPEQRHDLWQGGRVRARRAGWSEEARVKIGDELAGDEGGWKRLLGGGVTFSLPAHHEEMVLIDAGDYLCGYSHLEISGGKGAHIRWEWAEALYETAAPDSAKGSRDEIAGKIFYGFGDSFLAAGGRRRISSPWWRSGRFFLLRIKVAAEPLTLHTLAVERTGFPLEISEKIAASDATIAPIVAIAERGLQACLHEVFVDCPYYEQMMYVADTRLQMLLTYVMAGDDRLARRGMELFDLSRGRSGLPAMRHPSADRQESTTFALIWAWMLYDFALWRGDLPWLRQRLPGMRDLLERLETDADGLLVRPSGWLFVDWVPAWPVGWAPGMMEGKIRRSLLVNLHYLLTLQRAADLEMWLDEPAFAQRWSARARALETALPKLFWNEARQLWADEESHGCFSQHAQALAILAGLRAPDVSRWADAKEAQVEPATIYFQHYLFEALGHVGRGDLILPKLDVWRDLVKQGLLTTLENHEIGRSDCHAWGAHPVFHLHATIGGIRPSSPGFKTVRIAPQPGTLTSLALETPHPRGVIMLTAAFRDGQVEARVSLPPEVTGVFVWRGQEVALKPGAQSVSLG